MIAIVDYGMGNLRSVQKAVQRVGGDARIVRTPSGLAGAEKIVLPGVGAFGDAIARLREQQLVGPIVKAVKAGIPFLGLCLGLQLLFDVSYEDGEHNGLGIFPGKVVRFDFDQAGISQRLPIPHIGWNQIRWESDCPLLIGLDSGAFVYFVHSYYVVPTEPEITATTTDYGYGFTSAVWRGNVFATQFHPEKSQSVGLKILENFVKL
ncbi:MAG: imidazole glycerol phosphate synthase subunit HisH [Phycisphaerae bacterium]|nr:imidazole glycerol phosphate synthase subunit HisH [Phycisphaerae bacterium]